MNSLKNILFSILSGIILSVAWPHTGSQSYLIFVAFLPLLWVESELRREKGRFLSIRLFGLAYLAFIVFNIMTTWWIKLASFGGMLLAEIFNSLFMAVVFLLFHWTARFISARVGYLSLIIFWTAFEWVHINWELSWIWLNLGNVFAENITWIQWYEYTGALGGTIWILGANLLFFRGLLVITDQKRINLKSLIAPILCLLLPITCSLLIYSNYTEKIDPIEVVVVQPNIDPYHDKFGNMTEREQIDKLMALSEGAVTAKTEMVFAPETAFPDGYWEHDLEYGYGIERLRAFVTAHPEISYIAGLSTVRMYAEGEKLSGTARPFRDQSNRYYDQYNAAVQITYQEPAQLYRKSKLVLGVEKIPFQSKLKFLDDMAINLGGAFGSLGTEGKPIVFESKTTEDRKIKVIPAICYESIYAEYLGEFVLKGANLLAVITNDGWWGNTPGFEQHLAYSRLRAIELRRSVARSANTGISALIDQRGDILKQTEWWTDDALNGTLNLNDETTFYAKYGDFLGRIFGFFSLLLIAWTLVHRLRRE